MAYYLYDLYQQQGAAQSSWADNPMRFDTKEELLAFWYVHCGYAWENLNVTGNDINTYPESHYIETTPGGLPLVRYLYAPYLRRYLITDEAGRHQDIRDWSQEIKPLPRKSNFYGLYASGSKQHWRRASGPSMWRRTARAADEAAHQEDVDPEERVPPVRNKAVLSWLDQDGAYEKHYFSRHSRCWKDQSKAGCQYRRHARAGKGKRGQAPQNDNSLWESLIADGFPGMPRGRRGRGVSHKTSTDRPMIPLGLSLCCWKHRTPPWYRWGSSSGGLCQKRNYRPDAHISLYQPTKRASLQNRTESVCIYCEQTPISGDFKNKEATYHEGSKRTEPRSACGAEADNAVRAHGSARREPVLRGAC